jgi:predicted metal-dependent peptidase
LGTFAVDANMRLYIDFDAVASKGPVWCAEALLHECCHIFANDADRATDAGVADHERNDWNLSTDAANNDDLAAAGCKTIEADGVLPAILGEEDHQTAEFYLAALRRRRAARRPKPRPGGARASGAARPVSSQGQAATPFAGCGSGSGGMAAPCELDSGDDLGGLAPAATDAEKVRVRVATAAQIRDYAVKHPGTTPGGLVEIAEAVLAPSKLPWRQVLSSAIRRAVAIRQGDFDATWSRRNRRRPSVELAPGRNVVVPGTFSPIPRIVAIRDTSGSMSPDDLNRVGSEVEGIAKQIGVRGKDLLVIDVDAAASTPRPYAQLSDLKRVEGGGGTDMRVGIEAAIKLNPSAIVVLTDGYTPWHSSRQARIPVVVCLIAGPYANGSEVPESVVESVPKWMTTVCVDAQ